VVFWVAKPCRLVGENTLIARLLLLTETSGRQQLCHQKDNCARHAGHSPTYSECQPAEVRSAGWTTTRVLYSHGIPYMYLHSFAGM